MRHHLKTTLCVLALASLVACGGGGGERVAVTGVSVDRETLRLNLLGGRTVTPIATIEPAGATDHRLVWESSDQSVASVVNGVVTPIGKGVATIKVTTVDGGFSAPIEVTVVKNLAEGGDFTGITTSTTSWRVHTGGLLAYGVSDCTDDGLEGNCLMVRAGDYYQDSTDDTWMEPTEIVNGEQVAKQFSLACGRTYQVFYRAYASQAMWRRVVLEATGGSALIDQTVVNIAAGTGSVTAEQDKVLICTVGQEFYKATLRIELGYSANEGGTIRFDDIEVDEK